MARHPAYFSFLQRLLCPNAAPAASDSSFRYPSEPPQKARAGCHWVSLMLGSFLHPRALLFRPGAVVPGIELTVANPDVRFPSHATSPPSQVGIWFGSKPMGSLFGW